jgi:DnaJ homolog subfamily C member 28
MSIFEQIAEEKILEAASEGEFDNLSGKGKPLKMTENPFEPEEWRMANLIMHNNGFRYSWMEQREIIENDRVDLHHRFQSAFEMAPTQSGRQQAQEEFLMKLHLLNRRILDYNLSVPSAIFQQPALDPDIEMRIALGTDSNPNIPQRIEYQ